MEIFNDDCDIFQTICQLSRKRIVISFTYPTGAMCTDGFRSLIKTNDKVFLVQNKWNNKCKWLCEFKETIIMYS